MAQSHVVSGLVAKRAEVAGQIVSCQDEIKQLQGALAHLDSTIKLFEPDFNLRGIKSKRTIQRNQIFGKGESQRLVLDVMREAGEPLTSRDIADRMLASKGIEDAEIAAQVQKNALQILNRQNGNLVKQLAKNKGSAMTWELV